MPNKQMLLQGKINNRLLQAPGGIKRVTLHPDWLGGKCPELLPLLNQEPAGDLNHLQLAMRENQHKQLVQSHLSRLICPVSSRRTCIVRWAYRSSRRGSRCPDESSCRPRSPQPGGIRTSGAHTGCTRVASSSEGRYSHRSPARITSCHSYRLEGRDGELQEEKFSSRINQQRCSYIKFSTSTVTL